MKRRAPFKGRARQLQLIGGTGRRTCEAACAGYPSLRFTSFQSIVLNQAEM